MDNKENRNCAEKKNRARGENWTQEEKDMFLEIMRQSASIIENKHTDTNTNKRKNLEWVKIQQKLKELTGMARDIPQLKGLWRRTKLSAKKSVSQHRRALKATGGGQRPPSPPPNDLKIMDLCPIDFAIEENLFDSDAISPFISQDNEVQVDEVQNSTIYDLEEENEDITKELGISFVDEIVTVADIHSNEINVKPSEGNKIKIEQEKLKTMKGIDITEKKRKNKNTSKAAIIDSNVEVKRQAMSMMEEEYALKIQYQKQEIAHQQLRHKLEIDLLLLEKEKKMLEIELLKKNCNNNYQ